jgi:hypothetical protein
MAISEAAVSGAATPRTLKIKGCIQHLEVLVLIDSGGSNSFISSPVVAQLQGVSRSKVPMKVQVANGQSLQSSSEMVHAEWYLQGYVFHSDLKVLSLQHFDMELVWIGWKNSPL